MEKDEPVDWTAIKRTILSCKPSFAESLDYMIAFVATRSGGIGGQYLTYMQCVHRLVVKSSEHASLPGPLYSALAAFPHQYLAIAIWLAAWRCPSSAMMGRHVHVDHSL